MSDPRMCYSLSPAGYVLLQDAEEARLSTEYRRAFGRYSGVDRLPPLHPPDPTIRQASGEPAIENMRLATTVDEWFDAGFGATAFLPDQAQARRLLNAFRECGFWFELVYCEVAWRIDEVDRLGTYARAIEAPAIIERTYGFDVS